MRQFVSFTNAMQCCLSLLPIYYFLTEMSSVLGISPPFPSLDPLDMKKATSLEPCKACQVFADSFKKGMKETARGKHEGGDAFWEETRLGSYADSEVRLVEIQEMLCSDIKIGQDDCHRLAEEHESLLEDWWFRHKNDNELYRYFCVEKLKVCCQYNHYGSECKPCNGGSENPCNGHGDCEGNGTRTGTGQCKCHAGYQGEICDQCVVEYYRDGELCVKCHESCKDHCWGPGPLGCEMCADGYHHETNSGCVDDNECESLPCEDKTFCVNVAGSYKCQYCDTACATCIGEGPNKCIKCADGYEMKDGICIEINKEEEKISPSAVSEDSTENPEHDEL